MQKTAVQDWCNYSSRTINNRGILFSPRLNIEIGTWYIAHNLKLWKGFPDQKTLALASYNAGYSNMKKWLPENYNGDAIKYIQFPSTKSYVQKILAKYKSYSSK